MPEMPEVETIRRDLSAKIVGRKIKAVDLYFAKTAKNPAAFFKKSLIGACVTEIDRRGKLLIFKLGADKFLLAHLKMTGQLVYQDKKSRLAGGHSLSDGDFMRSVGGALPNKFSRARFLFVGGAELFFNDLRKFGYLQIVDSLGLEKALAGKYGPEPLSPDFNIAYLSRALSRRRQNIKAVLLSQPLVAGLGNIYVDESLFAAGIRPDRPAADVSAGEIKKLHAAINKIIKLAIDRRGTTFSNYVDSEGKSGNFSALLKVYGRGKGKCVKCHLPISKIKLAGRGTHYCANCQK